MKSKNNLLIGVGAVIMTVMTAGGGILSGLVGNGWLVVLGALIGLCGFWAVMIALRGEEEIFVENDLLPLPGYQCINLCGYVLHNGVIDYVDKNHEKIHTAQMKELLYIGFYLWYFFEWLYQAVWRIFNEEMKASTSLHLSKRHMLMRIITTTSPCAALTHGGNT